MKNRRRISNSSLQAGKAVRLVWPQPQVLNTLGLHGDRGKGGRWGCWTRLSRLPEFPFPGPCTGSVLPLPSWLAVPEPQALLPAQPPPWCPESTLAVPTAPSSARQLRGLFGRPAAIPSALCPSSYSITAAPSLR